MPYLLDFFPNFSLALLTKVLLIKNACSVYFQVSPNFFMVVTVNFLYWCCFIYFSAKYIIYNFCNLLMPNFKHTELLSFGHDDVMCFFFISTQVYVVSFLSLTFKIMCVYFFFLHCINISWDVWWELTVL